MGASGRVLVVDDDADIRDFVSWALLEAGYDVVTAPNGAVALDRAREYPPALILLDMAMPVMDGWAFADAYRREPGPHAPLVLLTARVAACARATDIAASGYLAKPFALDDLQRVVARHIRPSSPVAA
jgi:CheY-like chemotaxis protein